MQSTSVAALLLAARAAAFSSVKPTKPNMVWFLTDDQDQELGASFPNKGGVTPMPKTKKLMEEQGATALNWYIHTPICSPSRSELLSGRYLHNIKATGSSACHGAGCGYCDGMHINYTKVNPHSFARTLSEEGGYTVGMFGKYLNVMPEDYPPPGWDAWLANEGGSYIAPSFQTKNIAGKPDGGWQGNSSDYTTAVVGNASITWIKSVARQGKPWFAYVAPKAAHEPFNPAPWYEEHWDASWPAHEPRTPNWNCSAESRKDHHGNIATQPMLSAASAAVITDVFRNRWRTLMSVDDVIADVIGAVEALGQLDSTYFFYSSDHGFQLGQFNIPMDKRHVYTWDTKIHLLARGPGIAPGSSFAHPGTQVDLAPTFLGLAGLAKPAVMDGKSIVPLLIDGTDDDDDGPGGGHGGGALAATRHHIAAVAGAGSAAGSVDGYRAAWRTEVFIEYYYCAYNDKCVADCTTPHSYPDADEECGDLQHGTACWSPVCQTDCYRTEDEANNFIGLRRPPLDGVAGADVLYAEFQRGDLSSGTDVAFDDVDFTEYYDTAADPWQLSNLAERADTAAARAKLHTRLHEWFGCAGDACP